MIAPDATIAIVGETATAHESVQDAVDHVCAVTGLPRGGIWLRDDLYFGPTRDGLFVLHGRADERSHNVPVAWLTDGVSYQAAKSRGEMESVHDFF